MTLYVYYLKSELFLYLCFSNFHGIPSSLPSLRQNSPGLPCNCGSASNIISTKFGANLPHFPNRLRDSWLLPKLCDVIISCLTSGCTVSLYQGFRSSLFFLKSILIIFSYKSDKGPTSAYSSDMARISCRKFGCTSRIWSKPKKLWKANFFTYCYFWLKLELILLQLNYQTVFYVFQQ